MGNFKTVRGYLHLPLRERNSFLNVGTFARRATPICGAACLLCILRIFSLVILDISLFMLIGGYYVGWLGSVDKLLYFESFSCGCLGDFGRGSCWEKNELMNKLVKKFGVRYLPMSFINSSVNV